MDHFIHQFGELYAEEVPVTSIVKAIGTPFYCYSTATLVRHFRVFSTAFQAISPLICFSVKANPNVAVIKTLAQEGAGGDCVSEGEIRRCLAAGIPSQKIIFAGIGKTQEELTYALEQGIFQFNVESEPELRTLSDIATSKNTLAPVAIRVNPDIDAKTHDKISTGRKGDKFGIPWEQARLMYALAKTLPGIQIVGIATHIGSQLTALTPFQAAFERIEMMVNALRADGHTINRLDLGGGLGIPYKEEETPPPTPGHYASVTIKAISHLGCHISFEPGRVICGNAGILVSKVLYRKITPDKTFLIIDAAMNDLLRPSLYHAHHSIVPVQETTSRLLPVDVVGPVCETSDIFRKDCMLPPLDRNALVAIRSAGAYGASMASTYNSRPLIPEVLVKGDSFFIIRPRQTYQDMLALDKTPPWLEG